MPNELLNLPVAMQTALASGYAAYLLSYTGLRYNHKTIDVAFITLVFSLIATAIVTQTIQLGLLASGTLAFFGTCVCGLAWRKWGRYVVWRALRAANVTWSNDDPSALATLCGNSTFPVAQVAVQLDDHTWLECADTTRFSDAPYSPCIIGQNGDIGLYLTHEEQPDGSRLELQTVNVPTYGYRLTYIPAAKIRQITVRHMIPSHSSLAGAEVDPDQSAQAAA